MDDVLKARFTSEEISMAALIGSRAPNFAEAAHELFRSLGDPLLSISEVIDLLAVSVSKGEATDTLDHLVLEGKLQASSTTVRPLDAEECKLYRRADVRHERLRLQAQEARLGDGGSRYLFTCDGRIIRALAKVDRLDAIGGTGNQREEVRKHVKQIATGIENGNQIPNSVLLVILEDMITDDPEETRESMVRVLPLTQWCTNPLPGESGIPAQQVRLVELDFPYRSASFDDEKVSLLVDGQQRTAALSMVNVDIKPTFALSVNAVAADSDSAKKIFQIANSTQKIAVEFSRALMATMADAPPHLISERTMSLATHALAIKDRESPFYEKVKHAGVKESKSRPIAYNSLYSIVSIFSESALPVQSDPTELAELVKRSFQIVKETWPDAWEKKPSESRLVHGAGLRAMAMLLVNKLEALAQNGTNAHRSPETWHAIRESMTRLKALVIWTDAELHTATKNAQKFYKEEIMSVQNTVQDIAGLAKALKKESLFLDQAARTRG